MPEALEQDLRRRARRKHLTGKRKNAYIYGGLRAAGWRPKHERQRISEKVIRKFRRFFD